LGFRRGGAAAPAGQPPPEPPYLCRRKRTGEKRENRGLRGEGREERERKWKNERIGSHTPFIATHPNRFESNRSISNPAGPTRCCLSLKPNLFFFIFCTLPDYCYTPPCCNLFPFPCFFRYFVSIAFLLLFSYIFIHLRLLFCSHLLIVYLFLYFYFLVT